MNWVSKNKKTQREFDFTAIRIFFSAIAILLSVTMHGALAIRDSSALSKPSVLDKLVVDLKNQQSHFLWPREKIQNHCGLQNAHPRSNQNSHYNLSFGSDLTCPLPHKPE